MKTPTNRLFQEFRLLNGSKFHGQLTEAATYISTSKSPKRMFIAKTPTIVQVGDVISTPYGSEVLLMHYPKSTTYSEHFIAVHVNDSVSWKRPVKIIDPVAKVMRDAGETDMGLLHLTLEQMEDVSIEKMHVSAFSFYTGQDVQLDDIVDGKIVSHIRQVFGVKFVSTK